MTKNPWLNRSLVLFGVALALGALCYEFAHDIRMSAFIFLVTAFAGSIFMMISVVTKEG